MPPMSRCAPRIRRIALAFFWRDRGPELLSLDGWRSARTLRDLAPIALAILLADALLAGHPLEEVVPGAARHGLSHLLPTVGQRGWELRRALPLGHGAWGFAGQRRRSRRPGRVGGFRRRRRARIHLWRQRAGHACRAGNDRRCRILGY